MMTYFFSWVFALPLDQSLIFWKILLVKLTVYSRLTLQQRPAKQITPQGTVKLEWNTKLLI